jgi:hypothetical protein
MKLGKQQKENIFSSGSLMNFPQPYSRCSWSFFSFVCLIYICKLQYFFFLVQILGNISYYWNLNGILFMLSDGCTCCSETCRFSIKTTNSPWMEELLSDLYGFSWLFMSCKLCGRKNVLRGSRWKFYDSSSLAMQTSFCSNIYISTRYQ